MFVRVGVNRSEENTFYSERTNSIARKHILHVGACGCQQVRIFDPIKEKFVTVTVDDRIPCRKGVCVCVYVYV